MKTHAAVEHETNMHARIFPSDDDDGAAEVVAVAQGAYDDDADGDDDVKVGLAGHPTAALEPRC